jgi:hypothetical protein
MAFLRRLIIDTSVSDIIWWFIDFPWTGIPILAIALGFLLWIVVR